MKAYVLTTLAGALSASAAVIAPRQALSTVSLATSALGSAATAGSTATGRQSSASSAASTAAASASSGMMGGSSGISQSGSSSMLGSSGMSGSSSGSSTMMSGSSSIAAPSATKSVSGLPAPGAVPTGTPIQGDYSGQYRPQVHFTPPKGFQNDPNGLVYHPVTGWNLYYQYNPTDLVAGNQHWGHATSKDLYHWVNQPIALFPPNSTAAVFSGSAVLDPNNTSGFFPNNDASNPGVVAIYTMNTPEKQTQEIAYSTDGGMSFTPYSGNPVIDIGSNQFRDPKVIWYNDHWVMTVAHAQEMFIAIYTSQNLKEWTEVSRFTRHGFTQLQYECPGLQRVPIRRRNATSSSSSSSSSGGSSNSSMSSSSSAPFSPVSTASASLARRQASTLASGASSLLSGASSAIRPSSSGPMLSASMASSTGSAASMMPSASSMASASSTVSSAMPSSTGGAAGGSSGGNGSSNSSSQEFAWVMWISINPGAPLGGSITQYFVGDFNGTHFTPFDDSVKLTDFGKDNYAGQFFYNTGDQAVSLAWASNWQYTDFVPTANELWRSADSLPRNNYLVEADRIGWILASEPYNISAVRNSSILPGGNETTSLVNQTVSADFSNITSGAIYFSVNITLPSNVTLGDYASLNMTLTSASSNENLAAGYFFGGPNSNSTWIDRSGTRGYTGNPFFTSQFSQTAPTVAYNIEGVFDRSLFELFIDEGTYAATVDVYSQQPLTKIALATGDMPEGAQVQAAIWGLSSVWSNSTSGGNSTSGNNSTNAASSSSMMSSTSSMMSSSSSMMSSSSSMMSSMSSTASAASASASASTTA
ncbi:Invertase [Rhodotorula toruloides]